MATERLSHRAEALDDMMGVMSRLTNEAGALLDVLGGSLHQLGALTAPIHSRATALTAAQRNIAATKGEVDALLEHLDNARRGASALAAGPAADLGSFMSALEGLERSVAFLQGHASLSVVQAALGRAQSLFNRALETCHADFAATLAEATHAAAPSPAWVQENLAALITDGSREALTRQLVAAALLPKLQRMAMVMVDANYAPVRDAYIAARSRALDAILHAVAPETPQAASLSAMAPDALERVVAGWNRRLRALALLALSERRLAVSIWPEPECEELYMQLTVRYLRQLAQAGRDIIEARRVPEKVFALLDMHSQVAGVLPALEVALSAPLLPLAAGGGAASRGPSVDDDTLAASGLSAAAAGILREFSTLAHMAADAAAALFREYADVVAMDDSKILPPDGTIHPLTAQVVGYIKRLLSYAHATQVLLGSSGGAVPGASALAPCVSDLLSKLLGNLEAKARGYRDPALTALFLMNNVHYVQWSMEGGAAEHLLGRPWLERHKDLVEEWGARYQDITWGPLLALVQAEAPEDVTRLKQYLKDTFNAFNAAVERIYTTQSAWTIPDAALRDAVRRVIKSDVVPPYQDFLRRYAEVQFTSTPAKYIKYAASDINAIVEDDLFEAKVLPSSKLDLKQSKIAAII